MQRTPDDILDELLVLRVQDGERSALDALVSRWQPRLLSHARHLTQNADAAQDIVQETWLAVVRGIRRLRDPARFRGFVFRILSNKAADWVRQRQKSQRTKELDLSPEPIAIDADLNHDSSERLERVTLLRTAMTHLSIKHREVLNLYYGEGLGVNELARILHLPPGTVKSRLHSAREQLRDATNNNASERKLQ